jgi:hypothetical protein
MMQIFNQAGKLMLETNNEGKVVKYSDISGKEKIPATELCELCLRYGSDKCGNGYTKFYSQFFDPIKDEVEKVLEIGVSAGFSLKMWRDYFKNAMIYGLDKKPDGLAGILPEKATELSDERTSVGFIDQSDEGKLNLIGPMLGNDFDLIVDDGSHKQRDQQISLAILFPLVKPGRYYVIEDLVAADAIFSNPALRWDPTDTIFNDSTATFLGVAMEKNQWYSLFIGPDRMHYLAQNIEWIQFCFGCSAGEPNANPYQWGGPITVVIKKKDA